MNFLKKLILGLCLLLLMAGAAHAKTYPDVPLGYKHYEAIAELTRQGVLQGYPDGWFRPDDPIKRAEAVKILVETEFSDQQIAQALDGHVAASHSFAAFPDVPVNTWFSRYVALSRQHQIVQGYPDGRFRPELSINFAEALKVILKSHSAAFTRTVFKPSDLLYVKKEDWFQPYFSYARSKNLLNSEKFYHPATLISRGEFAEVMHRLKIVQNQNLPEFTTKKRPFSNEYTITIPKLNIVDLKVTFANLYNEKGSLNVLKDGLGYYLAPPGQNKKTIIFGHSSFYAWDKSPYNQILKTINQLKPGDKLYVNYQEKGYIYEIFGTEIIPGSQDNKILSNPQQNELTLYTCWPPGSIESRYLIHAKPVQKK